MTAVTNDWAFTKWQVVLSYNLLKSSFNILEPLSLQKEKTKAQQWPYAYKSKWLPDKLIWFPNGQIRCVFLEQDSSLKNCPSGTSLVVLW